MKYTPGQFRLQTNDLRKICETKRDLRHVLRAINTGANLTTGVFLLWYLYSGTLEIRKCLADTHLQLSSSPLRKASAYSVGSQVVGCPVFYPDFGQVENLG